MYDKVCSEYIFGIYNCRDDNVINKIENIICNPMKKSTVCVVRIICVHIKKYIINADLFTVFVKLAKFVNNFMKKKYY